MGFHTNFAILAHSKFAVSKSLNCSGGVIQPPLLLCKRHTCTQFTHFANYSEFVATAGFLQSRSFNNAYVLNNC